MSRAKAFKKAYRNQWFISNQKEAFIKLFFETLGFKVTYIGLGAGSEEYIKKTGSMPDIAILDPENNEIICYIEVTGSNKGLRDDSIYVTLDKFNKYHSIAKNVPVYYVYLCISHGKLMWSGYISYEDLYPYAEIRKDIVTRNFYGVDEYFIRTPKSLWKPLRKLGRELLGYLGGL